MSRTETSDAQYEKFDRIREFIKCYLVWCVSSGKFEKLIDASDDDVDDLIDNFKFEVGNNWKEGFDIIKFCEIAGTTANEVLQDAETACMLTAIIQSYYEDNYGVECLIPMKGFNSETLLRHAVYYDVFEGNAFETTADEFVRKATAELKKVEENKVIPRPDDLPEEEEHEDFCSYTSGRGCCRPEEDFIVKCNKCKIQMDTDRDCFQYNGETGLYSCSVCAVWETKEPLVGMGAENIEIKKKHIIRKKTPPLVVEEKVEEKEGKCSACLEYLGRPSTGVQDWCEDCQEIMKDYDDFEC
jgi:hypothetical protein